MGSAEMSKAGSHAVSGAADIALALGGDEGEWGGRTEGGALLRVKEIWDTRTHALT